MADKLTDFLRTGSPPPEPQAVSPSVFSRRESFMLDLEFTNGDRFALPYSSLRTLQLNPSDELIAEFTHHTVKIRGVNLHAVYQAVFTRSVGTLKAIGDRPSKHAEGVPVIYSIKLDSK